ncbi:alpha-1,2-fucosyltransferase [Chitinophaga sp.]|uniref:alpha-1,2-fucosyltransferase n=1 Tax=Chitinophaga sp. TaxID=1869181 RepID=UPI0031D7E0B3
MITFSHLGDPTWGRLGNQLFQIAATIGIAKQNGQDFIFPEWKYASCFQHQLPFGTLAVAQPYYQQGTHYYQVQLPEGNWDLFGFFQSEKFFLNVEAEVRHFFEPSAELDVYMRERYGTALAGNTCSIHVRRGDYLKLRYSFPPQSMKYYQKAMSLFDKQTKFLVFSDDIEWCKANFKGDQFYFVEGERDITDLFLMSRCQHHILSNSSFSWWGAWLNKSAPKRVICPEHWFGPETSINPDKVSKDIYASNFEPLRMNTSPLSDVNYRIYAFNIFIYRAVYNWTMKCLRAGWKPLKKIIYRPNH